MGIGGNATDTATGKVRRPWLGAITIEQLLNLVAAVGDASDSIDAQLQKVYEWHHARGVMGVQLAFAPAAVAALAIVAKDRTEGVIAVALVILVISVGVGLWRLTQLNRLHAEYVFALGLGRALMRYHADLAMHLYGSGLDRVGAPKAGVEGGAELYGKIGEITMVEYRSDDSVRQDVRRRLLETRSRLPSAGSDETEEPPRAESP